MGFCPCYRKSPILGECVPPTPPNLRVSNPPKWGILRLSPLARGDFRDVGDFSAAVGHIICFVNIATRATSHNCKMFALTSGRLTGGRRVQLPPAACLNGHVAVVLLHLRVRDGCLCSGDIGRRWTKNFVICRRTVKSGWVRWSTLFWGVNVH